MICAVRQSAVSTKPAQRGAAYWAGDKAKLSFARILAWSNIFAPNNTPWVLMLR